MKMEASTSSSSMSKFQFLSWEEILVSNEKGRREVHYYLKRRDGSRDLAVMGKERTLRHMSYSYVLPTLSSSSPPLPHKLKSRREVIDWLSSLVSDSFSSGLSHPIVGSVGTDIASDLAAFKDLHRMKQGPRSKDFLWLGSAWTCRKRRRHYQSFCRNGITVSVHDFIYVLAEENKRLVAYLEDLYEDSRGNKMVGVRWFHKIDEVGIILPPDFNDREIFFSLCLQDLSVECIDGLATVLSPQHFEKFRNEAANPLWEPFMCHRQFDNDDITTFDVTQVQGYWKQEILRYMYSSCPSKHLRSDVAGDDLELGDDDDDDDDDYEALKTRPKKKHRSSKSRDLEQQFIAKNDTKEPFHADIQKVSSGLVVSSSAAETCGPKEGSRATHLSTKDMDTQTPSLHLAVGCYVEVLSQDSGIRGCWFRAVVVKRHKHKVKVRYQDIKDAVDEADHLEEWVLGSRIAAPDNLGLRLHGRTTVRPYPSSNKGNVSFGLLDVGTPVDAWWHDGWWEGIVVRKESDDRVQVYFPGEGRRSNFGSDDLRHSQDWLSSKWNRIRKRPDLALSIVSGLETRTDGIKSSKAASNLGQLKSESGQKLKNDSNVDHFPPKDESNKTVPCLELTKDERGKVWDLIPNLANDNLLTKLKWNSRKRRRSNERLPRRGSSGDGSSSSGREDLLSPHASESFVIPNSLKLDADNCKYRGDSVLSASISTLTSLVMSR